MTETPWAFSMPAETVRVRDLDVAVRRKGSGEPLLFLHGPALTRRWLPFFDTLADDFDVIVPDHPGFGDTPRPDWLGDFSDLALHYRDLLDALGLDRVHLVGHSLGGWIAAEFAAVFPERVASLALIAPSGLRPQPSDGEVVDIFRLDPDQLREHMLGGDAERWRDVFAESDDVEAAVQAYTEATTLALLQWNPRYSTKLERRLGRIDVPAIVIVPDADHLLPASVGRRYAQLLPQGRLVTVSGEATPTEHLLILQEPNRVAVLIRESAGA